MTVRGPHGALSHTGTDPTQDAVLSLKRSPEPTQDMGIWTLCLSALVSTGGGLVFGYELAVISGALLMLQRHLGLSCLQQEALVSAFLLGALLASAVGGYLIDWQSRRSSILFSNVLTLAGTALLLVSSYSALVLGRVAVGFAVCISSMSCCIFVSELVRPEHRGVLVSLYEVGITVGILAAYTVNYIMADSETGWKWMFGVAVVPTLVQLVSICCLPPNTNCSQTQKDLNLTKNQDSTATPTTKNKRYNPLSLFQSQDNMRRRTVIGLGLVLFQQFTGQPNVLLYASTIFHSVGFQSNSAALLASVGLGLVKVLSTLTSMSLSDRAGRRPLLIGGCSVMAVGLITIGLFGGHSHVHKMPCVSKMNMTTTHGLHLEVDFYNETMTGTGQVHPSLLSPLDEAANWVILLSLMAVVSAYSVGFGPRVYFMFLFKFL